jgi:hypothetical protein
MSMYDYPLKLRFKLIALAPRIIVTDAKGKEILFVSQKIFKLKEDIRIYPNQQKEREIYNIRAEKILDFNTRYNFFTADTQDHIGSVKAKGWRSIWSATYMIDNEAGMQTNYITEDNPWVKIGDALFGQIPVVGMFTGYMFHPSYTCYRSNDLEDVSYPVMQLQKENAFFEGVYNIQLLDDEMEHDEELSALLSFMLMVQFMRRRG